MTTPPHISALADLPEHIIGTAKVRFLVPASATEGRSEVIEFRGDVTSPGPAPHSHKLADETFIVLDGAVEFIVAGRVIAAHAGTTVHIPRGTPHVFRYTAADTRMLSILAPAIDFETYLPKLRAVFEAPVRDMAKLAQIMAEHDSYAAP